MMMTDINQLLEKIAIQNRLVQELSKLRFKRQVDDRLSRFIIGLTAGIDFSITEQSDRMLKSFVHNADITVVKNAIKTFSFSNKEIMESLIEWEKM